MKYMTPYEHNQSLLAKMVPSMRYDGKEPFESWQEKAGQKLMELLGLPFERCADQFTMEYAKERKEYREIRFRFQSEEGYFVPCHLLVPKGKAEPLPVVICLQGHTTGMHLSLGRSKHADPGEEESAVGEDQDFAIRAVREGYCALAMEQRNFGECGGTEKGPDCQNSTMTALLIGRTTMGERVWDIQRAIDVLEKHFSMVDAHKIICMGNSGGGTAAFYAGCLEPRISYVMSGSAVCTYEDSIAARHHCPCNYIPGIRRYFEMGDLAGLIAPRYLEIVAGKDDPIFPLSGAKKSYELARSLFRGAGVEDHCRLVAGNGGHRFYADPAWPVMNAFVKENE